MFRRFFQHPLDYIFPLVLIGLLSVYAIFDVSTNAQAGNMDMSRGRVYILILAILVFLSLYMFINGLRNILKLPIIPSLFALLIWIILDNLVNNTMNRSAQINIMLCLLWIGSYYSFFQTTKKAHYGFSYNSFFVILFFIYCAINVYAQRNMAFVHDREYGMTSYSYYLLSFLPALLLNEKKIRRNVLIIICSTFVLLSLKRGPILALPIILFVYWITKAKLGLTKINVLQATLILIASYGAVIWTNHLTNGFLLDRFSSQELSYASGRDEMWTLIWEQIQDRNLLTLLFGTGSGTSIQLLGTGVHNEWLEFLFTFGAIGVLLYLFFFISLIKRYFKLIRNKSRYAPQYGSAIAFFFLSGLSDGFFFVYWTFYFFATIGYIEALELRQLSSNVANGNE